MSSAPSCDVAPVDGTGQDQAAVRLLVDAQAIHADHVADEDGYCSGCLRQWAMLARHPCSQDRWAAAVIDRHDAVAPHGCQTFPGWR